MTPSSKYRHVCIFLLFTVILPEFIFSQTDHEFWFAAPVITNAITYPLQDDTTNIDRPIVLNVSTSDGPAIIHISQPANPAFPVLIDTIQTDQFYQIDLTEYIDQIECKPANTVLSSGLLITSDKSINAIYEIQNRVNSESYSLKGRNALGKEFLIPSQRLYSNYAYCDPPARNSIAIVATEDETTVKIKPSSFMEGQTGLDTIFIILNRGQTWSGRALIADTSGHLGGSFVLSDKPIGVTVTDDAVHPDGGIGLSVDIAGDQLIPRELASNEYIVPHYMSNSLYYLTMIYIYAYQDSTTVNFNGNFLGIINRGEAINQQPTTSFTSFIQSNKPVEVYVFLRNYFYSSEVAGQIIPPLICAGSRQVSFARTGPGGIHDDYWVFLITESANQSNFTCSDPTIQNILIPQNFILIPSTGNQWGYYNFNGWLVNSTLTFSNSTGNFQATTINELRPGALRYSSFTSYSTLNLGPDQTICPGDSILLDAGYGRDSYFWSTGATTQTINVDTAGTYWVDVTDGNCNLFDTIVITNMIYTPVNLGPDTSLCLGDSIRMDAGGGKSWYLWNTGQTSQKIFIYDSGTYWVTVPVSHCKFTDSDTIKVSLVEDVNLGPDRNICPGDSTLLDAGLGMSGYIWNTGQTTQSIWAKSQGLYSVIIQKNKCSLADSVNVVYYPVPIVYLGPDTSICQGQTITFDAGLCSGCSYQWDDLSNNQMNIWNDQTYITGQAGIYRVTKTGSNGCLNHDTVQLFIIPAALVTITVTSSFNNVCKGFPITFYAHTTNGGILPDFQWKVNGMNAGPDDSIYTYVPSNEDVVSCILTSSNTFCISNNPAPSNQINMVINGNFDVGVSIKASANPACAGSQVNFTAIPVNGGLSPVYQWIVNGINMGPNNPLYSFSPNNGDVISCLMTSNIACPIDNPATSNSIPMTINPNLPAGVSIIASTNPFCPGNQVTFTAIPVNCGTNPIYLWKINGVNAGTNSSTLINNPLSGDSVSCIMNSNLACVTGNPASSNTIIMSGTLATPVTFTFCNDSITTTDAKPFKLKGGIPLGGTYSGSGVTNGIFYPALAGIGNHQIIYTYTNASLCSANAVITITTTMTPMANCGQAFTDIRDGKIYQTIQIGGQCWFDENLNYGTEIPSNQHQRDNCIPEKYTVHSSLFRDHSFYQWDEIMNYDETISNQGLCPPGWHVPTENDWQILFNNYQGAAFAGSPLLYTGFSGFNSLVYGSRFQNSSWNFSGFATHLWSSKSHGLYKAWAHGMNNIPDDHSVSTYPSLRSNAFSVRCLKN